MKILGLDEKAERSISVDEAASKVTVTHAVKPEGKASVNKVQLTWTFDFSNVSRAELLECAVRRLVVDQQNNLRNDRKAIEASDGKAYSVRLMLDAERATIKRDPVKTATNLLAGMSEEERKAILAKFLKISG